MKKTYTTPSTRSVLLRAEGMMAASLRIGSGSGSEEKVTGEGQILSNEGGFGGRLWDEMDD